MKSNLIILINILFLLFSCSENNTNKSNLDSTQTTLKFTGFNDNSIQIYIDSIEAVVDTTSTVPQFILNPYFDYNFNFTGIVMSHGRALGPSARQLIINGVKNCNSLYVLNYLLKDKDNYNLSPMDKSNNDNIDIDTVECINVSNHFLITERIKILNCR